MKKQRPNAKRTASAAKQEFPISHFASGRQAGRQHFYRISLYVTLDLYFLSISASIPSFIE